MGGSEICLRGIISKRVDMTAQFIPSSNHSFEGGIEIQQVDMWK